MREMRGQPAGWYRDRERPNVHRYWTGEHWSERTGEELALDARARVPEQRHQEPDLESAYGASYGSPVCEQRACG